MWREAAGRLSRSPRDLTSAPENCLGVNHLKLKTTTVADLDRIYAIKDAWSDLVCRSVSPWIFSLPEWSIAYLRTFGADCRLHLALAWDNGELVGVLPLVEKRGKAHDLFLTRYEPISGLLADYHAPIIQVRV